MAPAGRAPRVRACRDLAEYRAALGIIGHYFAWEPDDDAVERFLETLPRDRLHAALVGGAVVGAAGSFPLGLTVPGGAAVPCAGVSLVAVLPSHRRQGVNGRLMRAQLADARARGETVAALYASDERIYGRYGYGLAAEALYALAEPAYGLRETAAPREGSVRLIGADEAARILPPLYERIRPRRAGLLVRTEPWWRTRTLNDGESRRFGAGPLHRALLELDGRPAGYALYRLKAEPGPHGPVTTVRVLEAIGEDGRSARELWRFLLAIDWIERVEVARLPTDHPLLLQAARLTRLHATVHDGLWLRVLDVEAALGARSYGVPDPVTVEVTADPQFPDNVGRFTVADGRVTRSRRRPDVRVDVQALASAYLGGFSFRRLADAERAEEGARGGIARADAAFATVRAPWCLDMF